MHDMLREKRERGNLKELFVRFMGSMGDGFHGFNGSDPDLKNGSKSAASNPNGTDLRSIATSKFGGMICVSG